MSDVASDVAVADPLPVSPEQTAHMMLGMRLDYLDWPTGVSRILSLASAAKSAYICIPDAGQCVLCHDDESHRAVVNGADLVMTDSMVLQRTRAILHGVKVPETIRGADLMLALCRAMEERGMPIALVGGRDDAALDKLKAALLKKFPSLAIAHAFSPPFRPATAAEDEELTNAINASGARLVFVGLGCPKQERWMANHKDRVQATMIGVGAAFDFNAGTVKPPPAWVHRYYLEWFYRLLREPRRLWRRYLLVAPRLIVLALTSRH
jgi:N-acetylglucosaminyldiphosphoundecaprenol N-acetyl-beta-D-mannosaminyltransferase